MSRIEVRLERLEAELRFRLWVQMQRMLESMSVEELDQFILTSKWPARPDPPPGASRLDKMDRQSLLKEWKEKQEELDWRNDRHHFFAEHGHWPEQSCGADCFVAGRR